MPIPGIIASGFRGAGAAGAVFATMNPLDKIGSTYILSDGNLTVTRQTGSGGAWGAGRATQSKAAGKWYFEVRNNALGSTDGDLLAGIMAAADSLSSFPGAVGTNAGSFGWDTTTPDANKYKNGNQGAVAGYGRAAAGQFMHFAVDLDAGKVWIRNSSGSGWAGGGDPVAGTLPTIVITPGAALFPAIAMYSPPQSATVNFGASAFDGVVPAGFGRGWYEGTLAIDPNFSNVVGLLHFDGADNSAVIKDECGAAWTANGTAKLKTAEAKFGSAGLLLTRAGGADSVTTPHHAKWSMDTDYTLEGFIDPTDLAGLRYVATKRNTGAGAEWSLYINSTLNLAVFDSAGGLAIDLVGSTVVPTGVGKQHVAVTRQGNTWRLFLGGVLQATQTAAFTYGYNTDGITLGKDPSTAGREFGGGMDEWRFTRGLCRYSANFTPPAAAFPDAGPPPPNPIAASILAKTVAWWDHSEPSGSVAIDAHTGVHSGAYTAMTLGQPSLGAGMGTSVRSSSDTPKITYPHNAALNLPATFSVMAWAKPNAGNPAFPKILMKPTDAFNGKGTYALFMTGADNKPHFRFNSGGNYYDANGPTAMVNGSPYLLIGTKNATGGDLYVNNALAGSQASGGVADTATNPLYQGESYSNDGFVGWFGAAALFSSPLTSDERSYLWAGGAGVTYAKLRDDAIGTVADPYWSSVASLLNMNGPDGATFTDAKGKVWTPAGNAQIASSYMVLDGSGDYIGTAAHADFSMLTGDFTVEGFAQTSVLDRVICDFRPAGFEGFVIYNKATTGRLGVFVNAGTDVEVLGTTNMADGVERHFAISRVSGVLYVCLGGVIEASAAVTNDVTHVSGQPFWGAANNNTQNWDGKLRGLRITKGVGRYAGTVGATYAVPTWPLPTS